MELASFVEKKSTFQRKKNKSIAFGIEEEEEEARGD
jgi:hypothetical protein